MRCREKRGRKTERRDRAAPRGYRRFRIPVISRRVSPARGTTRPAGLGRCSPVRRASRRGRRCSSGRRCSRGSNPSRRTANTTGRSRRRDRREGRAELEGVHQEAEAHLSLFGREAQHLEHFGLQFRVVDTDRTAADLGAVADEVVGVGAYAAGVAVYILYVLQLGRGEGMVHGVIALRLVVPLEEREVHDPERRELFSGRAVPAAGPLPDAGRRAASAS